MRNWVKIIILFVIVFSIITSHTQAQGLAECDLCGYCKSKSTTTQSVPDNLLECKECLYPEARETPFGGDTLKLIKNNRGENEAPTPVPGKSYTSLGCLDSGGLGGFTQEGAAVNVIQTLLTIVFSLASGVALLYIFHGAFVILTSGGNSERLLYGKRVVSAAIIGLVFSLFSVFIVNFIGGKVLLIPGF